MVEKVTVDLIESFISDASDRLVMLKSKVDNCETKELIAISNNLNGDIHHTHESVDKALSKKIISDIHAVKYRSIINNIEEIFIELELKFETECVCKKKKL